MSAVKHVLESIATDVAAETHTDFTDAMAQVLDLLAAGVRPEDVEDVIADGWTVEQYFDEYPEVLEAHAACVGWLAVAEG